MFFRRSFFYFVIAVMAIIATSHPSLAQEELRDAVDDDTTATITMERSLLFNWLFGRKRDDDEQTESNTNDRGFFGKLVCGIFGCDNEESGARPVSDFINNLFNSTNANGTGSAIQEAFNASKNSETPLRDFIAELLNQPNSRTPVRDFVKEAFNRTDTPLLDFIAEVFNSSGSNSVATFVESVFNGTTSPIREALDEWIKEEAFGELNCTKPEGAPTCGYNIDGEEGIWICRTLYNPFRRNEETKVTHCAVPRFTLKFNDECGSCDGTYPTPCPCACDTNGNGFDDGVYILVEGEPSSKQCVNSRWAVTAVLRFDKVICATDCSA